MIHIVATPIFTLIIIWFEICNKATLSQRCKMLDEILLIIHSEEYDPEICGTYTKEVQLVPYLTHLFIM